MELTERERKIIAELEGQFASATPSQPGPSRKRRRRDRGVRPQWTVIPAAMLGVLLFVAGVVLDVGGASMMGGLLLVWWLWPLLWKLLRAAGRIVVESFQNAPPGTGL